MAVMLTVAIVTTPASTDQSRIPSTITDAVIIAGIGVCVRSLTSESFSGSTRSNDQAKIVHTGMNVLGNIAGRFQNRKLIAMSTANSPLLAAMLAMRL